MVRPVQLSRTGPKATAAAPARRPAGPSRALRAAVFLTATAAVAVAVALVVLGIQPSSPTGPAADAAPSAAGPPQGLTPTSPGSSHLAVGAGAYTIQVLAAAPCWVQIQSGTRILFAATLSSGQSHQLTLRGPATVELGSSGGRLVVTDQDQRFNLRPPVAPYSYSFS